MTCPSPLNQVSGAAPVGGPDDVQRTHPAVTGHRPEDRPTTLNIGPQRGWVKPVTGHRTLTALRRVRSGRTAWTGGRRPRSAGARTSWADRPTSLPAAAAAAAVVRWRSRRTGAFPGRAHTRTWKIKRENPEKIEIAPEENDEKKKKCDQPREMTATRSCPVRDTAITEVARARKTSDVANAVVD